jgi:hypothetical protein
MKDNNSSSSNQFKRLLFINVNKYQQQVLLPCMIICLLSCVGVFYAMYYINYVDQNIATLCSIDPVRLEQDVPWFMRLHTFNKIVPWIFFSLAGVLLLIVMWMYRISNQVLGPSARVLKELDDILSGQRKEPIGARPGDELFEELLKRINVLIQKMK